MRFLIGSLILSLSIGCAPMKDTSYGGAPLDATGYRNPKGLDYLHGGDFRVRKRIEEKIQEEGTRYQIPKPPLDQHGIGLNEKVELKFRERLIAFSIARFDKKSAEIKRMGQDRIELSIFLRKDDGDYEELKFKGPLKISGGKLLFEDKNPEGRKDYSLKVELEDKKDKVFGVWHLTKVATKEVAEVYYRAYKAKIKILTKENDPSLNNYTDVLSQLQTNTYGWANNWVVLEGRSFYYYDIVQEISNGQTASIPLSFSGESIRTGSDVEPDHPAKVKDADKNRFDVTLVGDAGTEGKRVYELTMKDPQKKESSQVLMIMDEENPEPIPPEYEDKGSHDTKQPSVLEDSEQDVSPVDNALDSPVDNALDSEPPTDVVTETDSGPTNKKPDEKSKKKSETESAKIPPAPARTEGASYFQYDMSSPKIRDLIADFKNNSSPGIDRYKTQFIKGKRRLELKNFFNNAYSLRPLIEAVGNYYESSAAFAYLTVVESAYLKGGKFYNKDINPKSTAAGPFQILDGTGLHLEMRVSSTAKGKPKAAWDERYYFAPAACGAARYIAEIADSFSGSKDATFAILGYYQGPTKARKIVDRAKRFAQYGGARFGVLASHGVLAADARDYVNKKLAVFQIGNDPKAHGFTFGPGREPPANTVYPPEGIKSRDCRQALAGLKPSS